MNTIGQSWSKYSILAVGQTNHRFLEADNGSLQDDGDVIFIEIVKKNDDSRKEEPEAGGLEDNTFMVNGTEKDVPTTLPEVLERTDGLIILSVDEIELLAACLASTTNSSAEKIADGRQCMTRSLTKELLTPFKNPEREFCLSRKLFKTSSLDKSSSPEFDLFFDLEEHSEEEVAEIMMETVSGYRPEIKRTIDEMPSTLLNNMQEVILFYNGLEVPTRQILDSKVTIPTKTAADAKTAIQEMAEYS
ncbi:hypothetical protein Tco_0105600 [Tanacetum coccineum]